MRAHVTEQQRDILVDSAGTGAWHIGDPPDPRSIETAARYGHDIRGYKARQVQPDDFARFDHIIALDRQNLSDLNALQPASSQAVLSLLLDHVAGSEGRDVADPYYGNASDFDATWKTVLQASRKLLDNI